MARSPPRPSYTPGVFRPERLHVGSFRPERSPPPAPPGRSFGPGRLPHLLSKKPACPSARNAGLCRQGVTFFVASRGPARFPTSLTDAKRFRKRTLAILYHERWQIETTYREFKQAFGADVLRSKTVDNVEKEFAAHVLAYQLVRRLITAAAEKHQKKPTRISFLDAARWVVTFSHRMAASPAWALPIQFQRLLDSIAASRIDVRPGRIEPRALTREWKHYPHLRMPRRSWREQRLRRAG